MIFENFIGGSYESQARSADVERTVNFYPEKSQVPSATKQRILLPTPGVTKVQATGFEHGRAHFAMDDREFALMADFLFEFFADGSYTSRGLMLHTNDTDLTPGTIDSSGDAGGYLFITLSGSGHYFDLTAGISAIPITALVGKATMGAYLDGYFLALDAETSTLYISNLLDVTTWDTGSDFAQRSLAADPWISMKVAGRYVWLFGEQTTEIWQDTGARFPFAPLPNSIIGQGIAAPRSVAVLGDDVVWLARNENGRIAVVRAGGVNPQIISTPALEYQISSYSDISGAVADSYSWQGHEFYELNFDTQGITHVWDAVTGLWFDKGSWNSKTSSYTAWRPRFHAYAFGEHRVIDSGAGSVLAQPNGGIYKYDASVAVDVLGNELRRLRRAPAIDNEHMRVFYSGFGLDLDRGLGTSGQAENPQIMMRMSNDGGRTWGSEQWRSAGKMGEYGKRVRWNRLGTARSRVFEVVMTDPIPWRITGAYLDDPIPEARSVA